MEDDTIAAGDDGNLFTRGGCTFEPVLNGHNSTVITCPSHQAGKPDVISSIFLGKKEFFFSLSCQTTQCHFFQHFNH